MKTVAVAERKHEWFGGKVIIDEIREYEDSRGSLTEVWRTDDEEMSECPDRPEMCYTSLTNPFVMRGPHQHKDQTDWFYTFKNRMAYHLYDPETDEMEVYFTDPTKITRVKVAPPIVHSYRNLEDNQIFTSNYPTSLFMGPDKSEPIDEIRWEGKYVKNQTFVVIGANGRLGKALTNELYAQMGLHDYHVIPVYSKLHNNDEINDLFRKIDTALIDIETGKPETERVTIINCSAFADVAGANDPSVQEKLDWSNVQMPISLCKMSAQRDWHFIQFSSDYVYQTLKDDASIFAELGKYTKSKIDMEEGLRRSPKAMTSKTTLIRVANLFSSNDGTRHNMVKKFKKIKRNGKAFTVAPDVKLYPSDVESLSEYLVKNLADMGYNKLTSLFFNAGKLSYINLLPEKSYTIPEFIKKYFDVDEYSIYDSDVVPWWKGFEGDINTDVEVYYFKPNEQSILDIIHEGD